LRVPSGTEPNRRNGFRVHRHVNEGALSFGGCRDLNGSRANSGNDTPCIHRRDRRILGGPSDFPAGEQCAAGVPDLRLETLPAQFGALLEADLPLDAATVAAGRRLLPQLEALVRKLAAGAIADSVEHADLHSRSVFAIGDRLRVLDWGDASIGHPFFSLVVTFDSLRETGLGAEDPWFVRLRDAYLEPWGRGLVPVFGTAQRLARVSRALGWLRHHRAMGRGAFEGFDKEFPRVLRTAVRALRTTLSG